MSALRERLIPEQTDFVKAVDAFCERECPPHLRQVTADGAVSRDDALYRKLAATGWLGLTIPGQYGGAGATLSDVALLTERLSYHRLPGTGYLTTVITAQALIKFGTEEAEAAGAARGGGRCRAVHRHHRAGHLVGCSGGADPRPPGR